MPEPFLTAEPDASMSALERAVERLHAAARAGLSPREFYRTALAEAAAATGAIGGAAWRRPATGDLELLCQTANGVAAAEAQRLLARPEQINQTLAGGAPVYANEAATLDDGAVDRLVYPVADAAAEPAVCAAPVAALELWFASGSEPAVRQGRINFIATLADVAADYHAFAELRAVRESAPVQRRAVDLLRRLQRSRDLAETAFEIINEGRRLLECDRLSLLVRRGASWRLAAVSGAQSVDRQTELACDAEQLALHAAHWGEPIDYPRPADESAELPPPLAAALERHVDHSHARALAAAPIAFLSEGGDRDQQEHQPKQNCFDVVLLAERFDSVGDAAWRRQLIEIGELCAPALARAAALDRWSIRLLLRWFDRLAQWRLPQRRRRLWLAMGAAATIVAALVFVPAKLTIEAPATLTTAVERNVFATATGSMAEVRVVHGQHVKQGETLLVLSDPELSLKLQQVQGEIDAVRKRLAALALTRTDRTFRERETDDRLPLSAEQRQLEEQLASLAAQRQLLEIRRESLTLRSPVAGQVLTRDVERLLTSRPVERGETLLTVADLASGWVLKAETPQRQIEAVIEAQRREAPQPVPAEYRLAGDVERTYPAYVAAISAAAPLEAEGLEGPAPTVEVRLAIDGQPPRAARPGMGATVRIDCGARSLGYVWLHDAWATLYRWLTF